MKKMITTSILASMLLLTNIHADFDFAGLLDEMKDAATNMTKDVEETEASKDNASMKVAASTEVAEATTPSEKSTAENTH